MLDYYCTYLIDEPESFLHPPQARIMGQIIGSTLKSDQQAFISTHSEEIVACVKTVSKWKNLKEYGKNAISAGDASKAFENIDKVLREHNIHVVPVGELENFVKVVGGHGPSWVNEVLKEHPDLEDDVYKAAKEFVKGIGL